MMVQELDPIAMLSIGVRKVDETFHAFMGGKDVVDTGQRTIGRATNWAIAHDAEIRSAYSAQISDAAKAPQVLTHAEKVEIVKAWLKAAGWTVETTDLSYEPFIERAKTELGYKEFKRARNLVYKTVRLLNGEAVQMTGGAPKGNRNGASPRKVISVAIGDLTAAQRKKYRKQLERIESKQGASE